MYEDIICVYKSVEWLNYHNLYYHDIQILHKPSTILIVWVTKIVVNFLFNTHPICLNLLFKSKIKKLIKKNNNILI